MSFRIDEEIKQEFLEKASDPSEVLRDLICDYLGLPSDKGRTQSVDRQLTFQNYDRVLRVFQEILREIIDIIDAISENRADTKEKLKNLRLRL